MKKFNKNDIFYNVIKTYPKVKLFMNAGQGHIGKQNYPSEISRIPIESIGLFDLINPLPVDLTAAAVNSILLENSDSLLTEGGDFIILES